MKVSRKSCMTGKVNTLDVKCSLDQLCDWLNVSDVVKDGLREACEHGIPIHLYELPQRRKIIQQVMPEVPAEQREFLISGMTPDEWNSLFI